MVATETGSDPFKYQLNLSERYGDHSLHESNSHLALVGGVGEEARMALSVFCPFSRSPSSDSTPVSFYPGMSAQISYSYRAESDWLSLGQWVSLGPIPVARELGYIDSPGLSHCTWE